jgi:hypothetical protein
MIDKHLPFTGLLPGKSATSTPAAVCDFDVPYQQFTVVATAGASTTAGTITVTLSNDGTNYFTSTSSNTIAFTAAGTKALSLTNTPARFVKVAITTTFSGGTLTGASVAAA